MRKPTDTRTEQEPVNEPDGEMVGFTDEAVAHLGAAPWWIVSSAFHGLLLLFVTLIGMVVAREFKEDTIIRTVVIDPPETPRREASQDGSAAADGAGRDDPPHLPTQWAGPARSRDRTSWSDS